MLHLKGGRCPECDTLLKTKAEHPRASSLIRVGGSNVPGAHCLSELLKTGANDFTYYNTKMTRCSVLRVRQQDFRRVLHFPLLSDRITQRELELFADLPTDFTWPLPRDSGDHGAAGVQDPDAETGMIISVALHELRVNAVRPASGVFSWEKVSLLHVCRHLALTCAS